MAVFSKCKNEFKENAKISFYHFILILKKRNKYKQLIKIIIKKIKNKKPKLVFES